MNINEMKMSLLVEVPAFKKDVLDIRKKFNIPKNGFLNQKEYRIWHNEAINQSEKIINGKKFQREIKRIENLSRGVFIDDEYDRVYDFDNEYELEKDNLFQNVPSHMFSKAIKKIGKKYNLPSYLVDYSPEQGLELYVKSGKISIPNEKYIIEISPDFFNKKLLLHIYDFLSRKELSHLIKDIQNKQSSFLKPLSQKLMRDRKNFSRDLSLIKKLSVERTKKPVRRKIYVEKGYLSIIKKQNNFNKNKMLELEKKHRGEITVRYDQITSREIGKMEKIKKEVVRKAIERLNKTAKELFGAGFNGKDNNVDT